MLKKQLIVLILIIKSLSASWYDNFHPSIEAGMHLSNFEGNIVNINSKTDFKDDLKYLDTSSSYFAIGIKTDYKYIPHFYINYFNILVIPIKAPKVQILIPRFVFSVFFKVVY